MNPNQEMVVLAREFRGMTQAELAQKCGLKQPRIARLEAGIGADLSEEEISKIADELAFPREFLFLNEQRYNYGSSSVFTRTRQLKAAERRQISGTTNVMRIQIKRMLDHIDIQQTRQLHRLSIEEYSSASMCAVSLRAAWNIPNGPIRNLVKLIEGAGVIIVECDFGSSPMDATSINISDMPPIIFISKNVPGDRFRFTLAHELAHLVMHDIPHPEMEAEADEFASEFLIPSEEISPDFTRMNISRLESYIELKKHWGVSIAALIYKAKALRKIDENQAKWLYIQMSKLGIRTVEPAPIQREKCTLFPMMIDHFRNDLKFSDAEFGAAIIYRPDRLKELYDFGEHSQRPSLRVV